MQNDVLFSFLHFVIFGVLVEIHRYASFFHRIHRRFLVVPGVFRVYSLSPTPKVAEDRGCALPKPYAEPVWLSLP